MKKPRIARLFLWACARRKQPVTTGLEGACLSQLFHQPLELGQHVGRCGIEHRELAHQRAHIQARGNEPVEAPHADELAVGRSSSAMCLSQIQRWCSPFSSSRVRLVMMANQVHTMSAMPATNHPRPLDLALPNAPADHSCTSQTAQPPTMAVASSLNGREKAGPSMKPSGEEGSNWNGAGPKAWISSWAVLRTWADRRTGSRRCWRLRPAWHPQWRMARRGSRRLPTPAANRCWRRAPRSGSCRCR